MVFLTYLKFNLKLNKNLNRKFFEENYKFANKLYLKYFQKNKHLKQKLQSLFR